MDFTRRLLNLPRQVKGYRTGSCENQRHVYARRVSRGDQIQWAVVVMTLAVALISARTGDGRSMPPAALACAP